MRNLSEDAQKLKDLITNGNETFVNQAVLLLEDIQLPRDEEQYIKELIVDWKKIAFTEMIWDDYGRYDLQDVLVIRTDDDEYEYMFPVYVGGFYPNPNMPLIKVQPVFEGGSTVGPFRSNNETNVNKRADDFAIKVLNKKLGPGLFEVKWDTEYEDFVKYAERYFRNRINRLAGEAQRWVNQSAFRSYAGF